MTDKVLILDTTLRDGEQAAGAAMTIEEKYEVAQQLDRLGVDIIEAGFPMSSPGDFAAVKKIADEIRRPIIAALSHANNKAVDGRFFKPINDLSHFIKYNDYEPWVEILRDNSIVIKFDYWFNI